MENALPYYGDLHMDAATKKLILNLLKSIRSVVPVIDASESTDTENDEDFKSKEYIRNVALKSGQHSDRLEGIFNPDELIELFIGPDLLILQLSVYKEISFFKTKTQQP